MKSLHIYDPIGHAATFPISAGADVGAATFSLLRRSAQLRPAPYTTCNAVPNALKDVNRPLQQLHLDTGHCRNHDLWLQQSNATEHGASVPMADVINQSQLYEWPGLHAWRARGIDRRLRWGPGPAPATCIPPSPELTAATATAALSLPAGAPEEVSELDAPTLESALLLLPPQQQQQQQQQLLPQQDGPHHSDSLPSLPASLVDAGLRVLRTACPQAKAALTHAAWAAYLQGRLPLRPVGPHDGANTQWQQGQGQARRLQREEQGQEVSQLEQGERQAGQRGPQPCHRQQQPQPQPEPVQYVLPERPARPERPRLVRPKEIPGHAASPLGLSGYMLHNLAHIELNAIDLAWDTVVRFSHLGLPDQFYEDFARVADDESRHLVWCLQRLGELGHRYGDMDAHDLLWQGCAASAGDVTARLAVVPMSQEARGLDAGGRLVARLVGAGDSRSAALVGAIAAEERAHVAVGVCWFGRICAALGLQPGELYRRWLLHLNPDLLKGPFNHAERSLVRLARDWYDPQAWPQHPTHPPPQEVHQQQQEQQDPLPTRCAGGNSCGGGDGNSRHCREGDVSSDPIAACSNGGGGGDQHIGRQRSSQGAVRQPRRPVRGLPYLPHPGPQPRLDERQLALLAERLAVFAEVEGAAAAPAPAAERGKATSR